MLANRTRTPACQGPCKYAHHPAPFKGLGISSRNVRCHNKLGDDLLDYVMAGPKMRKWYGQEKREVREEAEEGGPQPEKEEINEDDSSRDCTLVMDAESAMGEQVILQLILSGCKLKILVKDVQAAKTGYGPYVEPVSIDVNNANVMKKLMRNVSSVICLGPLGSVPAVAKQAGVQRLVLLSASDAEAGGLFSMFDREMTTLKDRSREAAVQSSGVPCTIVRTGPFHDVPGGSSSLLIKRVAGASGNGIAPSSSSGRAKISREDLACVLATAAQSPHTSGLVLEVQSSGEGTRPDDWDSVYSSLAMEQ